VGSDIRGRKYSTRDIARQDGDDEALTRWKQSLGLSATGAYSIGEPGDMRRLVVLAIRVVTEGNELVDLNLQDKVQRHAFSNTPTVIRARAPYQITVRFRVQHEIITGLRYYQVARRGGIPFSKTDVKLGSYAPNTKEKPYYEVSLPEKLAPGIFIARGTWQCTTQFVDDDHVVHDNVPWLLQIAKPSPAPVKLHKKSARQLPARA
jgi:Rho GDP-dissociation inhibitor